MRPTDIGPAALERAGVDAQLVALGRAIGHPVRLRVVRALAGGDRPASATEVHELIGGDPDSITRQLRALEQLGVAYQTGARRHQRVPVRRYALTDVGRYLLERGGVI